MSEKKYIVPWNTKLKAVQKCKGEPKYRLIKLPVKTKVERRDQEVIMTGVFCATSVGKRFVFP